MQVLYIDNDTIITGDLSTLSNTKGDIAAVLNRHKGDWSISNLHPMLRIYYSKAKNIIEEDKYIKEYFNGGVIFCRDTDNSHKFFQKWHELWLNDSTNLKFHKDQPSMWRANYICGHIITPVDGIYNCQLAYPRDCLKYLFDAKIIHYFSSNDLANHIKFKQKEELKYIREYGIDNIVKKNISNITNDYINGLHFYSDAEVKYFDKPLTIIAIKLSKMFPFLNYPMKYIIAFYLKLFNKTN